jgi:hypothetical protein
VTVGGPAAREDEVFLPGGGPPLPELCSLLSLPLRRRPLSSSSSFPARRSVAGKLNAEEPQAKIGRDLE